jgi:hypothetical protein
MATMLFHWLFALLTGAFWLCILAALLVLYFIGPFGFIWDSWAMLSMRAEAPATVTKIDAQWRRGQSRPIITYEYAIAGQQFESNRYLPGLGNSGTWSGGTKTAAPYVVGQIVAIHYDPRDPQLSCLEYGWFKWPIAIGFFIWGLTLRGGHETTRQRHFWPDAFTAAMMAYGFGLVVIAPNAIRPTELHWHVLAYAALVFVCACYDRIRTYMRSTKAEHHD